jgi:hypothetical protein
MASSQRSRRSEVKDGQFDAVGCGVANVGPNYLRCNFPFSPQGNSSLLFLL